MGATVLRRALRRRRHQRVVAVVLAVLTAAVAAHHAVPPVSDGHHHEGATAHVVEVCLAAFVAVGAAVAVVAIGLLQVRRRAVLRLKAPYDLAARAVPGAHPRAGPDLLARLCVSRR